jgi:hypothetical protein
MSERQFQSILLAAQAQCHECRCPYSGGPHCTVYWRKAFVMHFGKLPEGPADPQWDELLKLGYAALRTLDTGEEKLRTAS